ncbi:MAG: ATP-binding protein [Methylococcaceae bacterium]
MYSFIDFKGFKNAHIPLSKPMTLLIGRNGSGKTNVIEGIELLAQLASGRPLHEINDIGHGNGNGFEIRGGLQGCMRKENNNQDSFTLFFNTNMITYQITLHSIINLGILTENLIIDNTNYFKATKVPSSNILTVSYNNFSRGKNKPTLQLPADCSVLSQYSNAILMQLYLKKINADSIDKAMKYINTVKSYLKSAFVFDLHPHVMRNYERIGASQLTKDGSNLSSILYTIKINDENKELSEKLLPKLLDKLKQLPEEPFIDFEFITTQANDVLLALKREDGLIIDARLLSDGTLRTLAILTALETIPEHSRIVIEELDNGIHPSRVKLLIDTIWECSHKRKLNVLVTSHNPATLNSLTPEQLDCVVVCHYDHQEKADKLTPLLQVPYADVLLQKGALGDLVTRNVLENYLMPNFEQEQQRKAQEWLDLF